MGPFTNVIWKLLVFSSSFSFSSCAKTGKLFAMWEFLDICKQCVAWYLHTMCARRIFANNVCASDICLVGKIARLAALALWVWGSNWKWSNPPIKSYSLATAKHLVTAKHLSQDCSHMYSIKEFVSFSIKYQVSSWDLESFFFLQGQS